MYHIFFVHGHITYYLSRSIIDYLKLPESRIILLLARDYNNKFNTLKSYSLGNLVAEGEKINSLNFFESYGVIDKTDESIKNLIGSSPYALYLPHFGHPLMQILATNNNCVEVNYMEEGSNCYASRFLDKPIHNSLRARVNIAIGNVLSFFKVYGKGRYFKVKRSYTVEPILKKFNCFYTISPAGFKTIAEKKMVIPFYKEEALSYKPMYSDILILEAGVEQNWITKEKFFDAINYILKENRSINNVSIKFHPAQTEDNMNTVLSLLESAGVNYEIIPNDVSMEQVFNKNEGFLVIGFASSLLIYALMLGHEIKSYEEYLKNIDSVYRNFRSYNDFNIQELQRGLLV